jgi:hypothetical protein
MSPQFLSAFALIYIEITAGLIVLFALWQALLMAGHVSPASPKRYWFDYRNNRFMRRMYTSLYELMYLSMLVLFATVTISLMRNVSSMIAWLVEIVILCAGMYHFGVVYQHLEARYMNDKPVRANWYVLLCSFFVFFVPLTGLLIWK